MKVKSSDESFVEVWSLDETLLRAADGIDKEFPLFECGVDMTEEKHDEGNL